MKKIIAIIAVVLLAGCATKPASQTIATNAINQAQHLIDYANHNFPATSENKLLITGLQNCQDSLKNTVAACETEKDPLHAKISYWRLVAAALAGIILLMLWGKIKNLFIKVKQWML